MANFPNVSNDIVKYGWVYEQFNVSYDRAYPGYWFIEVMNELEDKNCDAYVVMRHMRVDTKELEAIRLFIEKNNDRKQFYLQRCPGGPITIAVECY